jgi:hypothetical protein
MMKQQAAYILILVIPLFLLMTDTMELMAGSQEKFAQTRPVLPMGPLKVNPVNPRYFSDSSGRAVYLTGSHTWNNFQEISIPSQRPIPFDFSAYLDFLHKHNHNFFRLWTWEQSAWAPWTKDKILFQPLPYMRTGPGDSLDGGLKFDLTKFNQSYFDRLRSRVMEARKRGIYVSVMLFQGFSIDTKGKKINGWFRHALQKYLSKLGIKIADDQSNNPWRGHPFNVMNNINGINGDPYAQCDGKDVHTLKIPQISRLQHAYVKKVIDTLNDLDNVLWEISNESHSESTQWQYHMIDFIHQYEKTLGRQHPVLMTVQYPNGRNAPIFISRAEAVSPNEKGGYREDPPVNDGHKVIINDTDHLWGIGGDYRWVWKSFLRGLNPIFMDPYTTTGFNMSRKEEELTRKNMGYTLRFAGRMNLISMTPRSELASSGYCLAENGKEYLVYVPQHADVKVDLSRSTGKLTVEWFNPLTGISERFGAVAGGALRSFTPPFNGDAILYVYRSMPEGSARSY